jgi:hypothetical protein
MEEIIAISSKSQGESAYKTAFPRQWKSSVKMHDLTTNIVITGIL